ncbi:phosphoribosyltransferase [Pseudorhizobium flavum]|uniref:Putative phosphoribosyltransferase n=1 Tax=Pseudorhizobium flavum TaxID=1335061 RepID=A0A7X0DE07_9HYPH|nr:phosphoribosyltransferase [Pseudorhizobium flavum]MBB6181280.1 putative phosphoribosyltransferase [Pseudorhizobium flavum]CAD6618156.1 phosphoribosyltransferase [Pseudorhizobium flavum]
MFSDRKQAGQHLATALQSYTGQPVTVFALPRGGLPVALEVAKSLGAPLELALVRKIGLPFYPEVARGAVMDGDPPAVIRNDEVISHQQISERDFEACLKRELAEIQRRRGVYIGDRLGRDVRGRTVIIVDDGLATGATMRAAIKGLRARQPDKIVVAVPVCALDVLPVMRLEADDLICLEAPPDFQAVGMYYRYFPQLTDQDVLDVLKQAEKIDPAR